MKCGWIVAALVPCFFTVAWLAGCQMPTSTSGDSAAPIAEQALPDADAKPASGGFVDCDFGADEDELGLSGWSEPGFNQSYTIYGNNTVHVSDHRHDAATDEWTATPYSEDCTFALTDIVSAGLDLFCIAGVDPNGDVVLQVWRLALHGPDGPVAPAHRRDAAQSGNAATIRRRFVKTEIYRGPLGTDGLLGLEFDAGQARFILALVKFGEGTVLYKLPNEANTQPIWVTDSGVYPPLARMEHLQKFVHEDLGPVWSFVESFPAFDMRMLFVDKDDDGVFDGRPILGSYKELQARGLMKFEKWNSLMSARERPTGRGL